MTFVPEKISIFLAQFEEVRSKIRAFEGCEHLELLRAETPDNVLFTLSDWADEAALERYRHSELFAVTWAKTKVLFSAKAEAWTVAVLHRSA